MKMSQEMRDEWTSRIEPLDTIEMRDAYRAGNFPRADLVKDLDKRYRWDLLNAAMGWRGPCAAYDAGMNDTHIDTALRSIVDPL